jgi:hypothetical protein
VPGEDRGAEARRAGQQQEGDGFIMTSRVWQTAAPFAIGAHGVGVHPAASACRLKCVLVQYGVARYSGSTISVETTSNDRRRESNRSKYSVMTVVALYGTPFLRKYPASSSSSPPSAIRRAAATAATDAVGNNGADSPTSRRHALPVATLALRVAEENVRVCVPASVSSFNVVSSCHVMCTRVGMRIRPAAP